MQRPLTRKPSALARWLHRGVRSARANESGLTLLEALVAIIVIGITASAITPAFVLAVATRVQSQRVEQAMQLAQSEVDKARLIMELGTIPDIDDTEDPETRQSYLPLNVDDVDSLREVGAPAKFLKLDHENCEGDDPTKKPDPTEACAVDVDGDDRADFAVQVYRINPTLTADGSDIVAFDLGVRVYAFEATRDPDATGENDVTVDELLTVRASAGLTSNTDDGEVRANYRYAPLAIVYTAMARSETANSLCEQYRAQGLDEDAIAAKGVECDPSEEGETP